LEIIEKKREFNLARTSTQDMELCI